MPAVKKTDFRIRERAWRGGVPTRERATLDFR